MTKREIDYEIQQKNYDKELLLCKKAGGDVERYRRLLFDTLQLEQIRRGLESGVDVELYLDPGKSWLEMEEIRVSLETGFDMKKYLSQGFDWMQCNEIRAGFEANVDVGTYLNVNFLSSQMREIRKGLQRGLDVKKYASPEYDWLQMKEIRLGLQEKLKVSAYAVPECNYATMRAIRLGLLEGIDLMPYIEKGYSGALLNEIGRAARMNYSISDYLEQGYDAEQLKQINNARESGVNLIPYLRKGFQGVQLEQIIIGLKKGLDVSKYADVDLNWFQMREIRHGLEQRIDVSHYASPQFSPKQMKEIRKGLVEGVDVSQYAKVYYEPEQMEEIRHSLGASFDEMSDEMKQMLQESEEENVQDTENASEESQSNYVLDSCVVVAEDRMSATINFAVVKEMMPQELERFTVPDVIRLLKHHDVSQGIQRSRIHDMLKNKKYDQTIVVAEGKKPEDGEDGKFIYYFRKEINRKPRVLEDGSVDYKSMELFETVKRDMLLAEYQPATSGTFGYDVTGRVISPRRGKELPPLRGEGFMMSENRRQYYALTDGIVELDTFDNRLMIRNLFIVPGDVDVSVGNIHFNGDINIMGNVLTGFSVSATGNVVVDGHCEECQIEAGKDVIIRKGCQGNGKGRIIAGGSITGQFFESVTLLAAGDVEASYLLNCQVKTKGNLLVEGRRGVIIGGYICAKRGVSCFGIGNIAEIKTTIEVGIDKEDMMSYQELQKKLGKVDAELVTCENALHKFMDEQDLDLDQKKSEFVEQLTKAVYTKKLQKKELEKEKEERMEQMTKQREARIRVSGRVYPGTLLYLNSVPFSVKNVYSNVDFVTHSNQIETVVR